MSDPADFVPTIYGDPPPVGTPTWLRQRRTGIGGSDAAAVLGVSPWASALGVWADKRGLTPPDSGATERMLWGQRLEAPIRAGYNKDYGTHYRKPRQLMRHERWPFVIGNLDGIDGSRVLEVKTSGYRSPEWGEEGTDAIPAAYYAQVQHYLMLIAGDVAELAALFGGNQLARYEVPANRAFEEALLDDEARLWQQVVAGTPPEPDGTADAGAVLRQLYPNALDEAITATPEVAGYAAAYLAAKSKEDTAKREKDHAAQLMQVFMGERRKLKGDGYSATWSEMAGRIDWKAVAEAYRRIIEHDHDARGGAETDFAAIAEQHRAAGTRSFRSTATK